MQMSRAPAGGDRDGRDDDGPPLGRALHPRPRRVRAAGRRGLVRQAVREAARPHARVRGDRARHRRARGAGHQRRPALPAAATRTGPASASRCKSTIHPVRDDIPIYLGAEGPKNVALAAEICDGWLALFFSPAQRGLLPRRARRGLRAATARGASWDDFEVAATVPVIIHDDVEEAADFLRPDVRALLRRHGRARARTSTTTWPCGWATRPRPSKIQDLYLDGQEGRGRRGDPDERWSRSSR